MGENRERKMKIAASFRASPPFQVYPVNVDLLVHVLLYRMSV
jgi:hypothetical protein